MNKVGYFEITSVHREDLKKYFTSDEIAKLTDEDMKWIASKMADAYTGNGQFWDDLKYFTRRVLDEREF
jgi:hypothetical protein